jgi:hypothetical protein
MIFYCSDKDILAPKMCWCERYNMKLYQQAAKIPLTSLNNTTRFE